MKKSIVFSALICLFFSLKAQESSSPILFIYDASGSMWGQIDGKTKKEIAAQVLTTTITEFPADQSVGLIAYGHRRKGDCDDIEYLVDLNNRDKIKVGGIVKKLNSIGKTPLARSAIMAIQSLKESNTKATIILITDGIESCDGDLCKVVTEAKANGIDFKLHIVGFGLKAGEKEQLKCAASAGDGAYFDANDAGGLGEVLIQATSQTVDDPDGNFSVFAVKNGEPVDAWVRVRNKGNEQEATADRTYRDTAWMYLAPGEYEIEVQALEGTDIPSTIFSLSMKEEAQHRDVSFDGGILEVSSSNNGEPWDATVRMYNEITGKQVASTRTYGKTKRMEVPAGMYRVEYLGLQLKGANVKVELMVEVKGNETTAMHHNFKSGILRVGVETMSGDLIDATVNVHEMEKGKSIAAGRTYTSSNNNPREFLLTPGTYEVKLVTLGKHKGHKKNFTVTVKENETIEEIVKF